MGHEGTRPKANGIGAHHSGEASAAGRQANFLREMHASPRGWSLFSECGSFFCSWRDAEFQNDTCNAPAVPTTLPTSSVRAVEPTAPAAVASLSDDATPRPRMDRRATLVEPMKVNR